MAQYAGEGHVHAIRAVIADLIPRYRERGSLQGGRSPYRPVVRSDTQLRFPAKAIALGDNGFLVADAGHHSVVELAADAETVVRRFGTGERGLVDGPGDRARFSEPNGLCALPRQTADVVGFDVVVADTANHALRGLDLRSGRVRTLAGNGHQWMQGDGVSALSSPWDVAWWRGRVWVAMAGIHQLWSLDPVAGDVRVEAGTTQEGLVDGRPDASWFAQPSGLAPDGGRLWIADAEVSALRWLDDEGVHTAVGQGLFDFGFRDGGRAAALMQHPLGVAVLADGSVAVADTYNDAVRRYDPVTKELTTLASGLAEVSGIVVRGNEVVVVASGEHRLVALPATRGRASGFATTAQREAVVLAPRVELVVAFTPPPGQRLDDRFGAPARLTVTSTPPGLLRSGEGRGESLTRSLALDSRVGSGVLHVVGTGSVLRRDHRPGSRLPDAPAGLGDSGHGDRRRVGRARASAGGCGRDGLSLRTGTFRSVADPVGGGSGERRVRWEAGPVGGGSGRRRVRSSSEPSAAIGGVCLASQVDEPSGPSRSAAVRGRLPGKPARRTVCQAGLGGKRCTSLACQAKAGRQSGPVRRRRSGVGGQAPAGRRSGTTIQQMTDLGVSRRWRRARRRTAPPGRALASCAVRTRRPVRPPRPPRS